MQLDKDRPYGTIKSINPKQKVFFNQDGIDYGRDGKPVDKKQVRAYNQKVVDAAQKSADEAKAIADAAQAEADAAQAMLDDPDAPKTIAALKESLDDLNIVYGTKDSKDVLEQLWVDAQAV